MSTKIRKYPIDYRPLAPTPVWELALGRATVALHAEGTVADLRELLDMLGLGSDAGPRVRLADLEHRPDRNLRREPGAPPAMAPPSAAVLAARAAAKRRRHEAAADHFRAQGLRGSALRAALARLGG